MLGYTILSILSILLILFQIYEFIDFISLSLPVHFSSDARLTRENIYFVESGDIFRLRPDTWLLSFVGLKFSEVKNFVDLVFYIEGRIIFLTILFLIFYRSKYTWLNGRLSVTFFILSSSFFMWLIISNYPMSILNPGSGMRYRSGVLPALLVFLSVFPMVHASFREVSGKRYTRLHSI